MKGDVAVIVIVIYTSVPVNYCAAVLLDKFHAQFMGEVVR